MIEICANSVQSAINAQAAGAERVELCDNLFEGGTTPSAASIKLARKYLSIGLNVLIRPRGSDFLYSDLEMEIIREDIRFCKAVGCDGVVLGFLNSDGAVDTERTAEMVELSHPMQVTFHRAFDMTPDPKDALEKIILSGAHRILTSGQKNKAYAGMELLKKLVDKAGKRIIIMPGSGISQDNIGEMITKTGAKEFHLSAIQHISSEMSYRKEGIYMGGLPQIPEYDIALSNIKKIKNVVEADQQHYQV